MTKGMIFMAGLAVGIPGGVFLGKLLTQKAAEERIEEEVESVKAAFRKARKSEKKKFDKDGENSEKSEKEDDRSFGSAPKGEEIEAERKEYRETIRKTSYRPADMKSEESIQRQKREQAPVVIPPDELGDEEEWGPAITLTYYEDGTICDEHGHPISDADIHDMLGDIDVRSEFGHYEDDSVDVKNPRLKTYYEILRDVRTYKQALAEDKPYIKG